VNLQKNSIAWNNRVYRFAEVEYASKEDLISGLGAKKSGGRWNPKASFPVLYTSLTPETALAELKAHYDYYALDFADATPTVLTSIDVDLQHVLDITIGRTRIGLRISLNRMKAEDWRKMNRNDLISLTQSLGRKLKEEGFEAILVPSFAHLKSHNLVIFLENLRPTSSIRIANQQKLPPKVKR
jgi:RES domain-containing protein